MCGKICQIAVGFVGMLALGALGASPAAAFPAGPAAATAAPGGFTPVGWVEPTGRSGQPAGRARRGRPPPGPGLGGPIVSEFDFYNCPEYHGCGYLDRSYYGGAYWGGFWGPPRFYWGR